MRLFHNPVVRLNSLKIIEKCFNLWYNCHWILLTKQSFTKCRWLNPSCLVYPSASTELCTRLQHKERALTGHWLPWSPLPGTMSLLFCWVWICFKYLAQRYVKRSALFFKHEKRNKPSVWKEAPNRHMPYCLTVWGDQSSITPPPRTAHPHSDTHHMHNPFSSGTILSTKQCHYKNTIPVMSFLQKHWFIHPKQERQGHQKLFDNYSIPVSRAVPVVCSRTGVPPDSVCLLIEKKRARWAESSTVQYLRWPVHWVHTAVPFKELWHVSHL